MATANNTDQLNEPHHKEENFKITTTTKFQKRRQNTQSFKKN